MGKRDRLRKERIRAGQELGLSWERKRKKVIEPEWGGRESEIPCDLVPALKNEDANANANANANAAIIKEHVEETAIFRKELEAIGNRDGEIKRWGTVEEQLDAIGVLLDCAADGSLGHEEVARLLMRIPLARWMRRYSNGGKLRKEMLV